MIWITLGIIIVAISGFLLARYIKSHKYAGDHMVCPLGSDCKPLVTGRFSRFFGISVEYLGMGYYGIIALLYTVSLFRELPSGILLTGLLLSGIAFAFSMYLTIIQIFVVKKWCTLCLGSASLSFMIIVLAFLGYEYTFIEFAYTYRDLLKWLYFFGVILGTIITTFHARTFIMFLKDFTISKREERRLEMFSNTAWVALGISFLAGLGFVMTDRWREITDSSMFIVMVIIMGMLIAYEVIMNMIISPRLVDMHFDEKVDVLDHPEHTFYRKLSFAFITVGVVSWYSLLLLSSFNWFSYSSGELLLGYAGLLVLAVVIAMVIEVIIYRKAIRNSTYIEIPDELENLEQ